MKPDAPLNHPRVPTLPLGNSPSAKHVKQTVQTTMQCQCSRNRFTNRPRCRGKIIS